MSNITFVTDVESAATAEIAGLVIHDFTRQADDEVAGRGVLAYTYSVGGPALQSGPLAA